MSREPRYVDARFAPLYLNTTACEQIKFMPTAQDVVKVVRCKDCKYLNVDTLDQQAVYFCTQNVFARRRVKLNDFCSYGARMDGEEIEK